MEKERQRKGGRRRSSTGEEEGRREGGKVWEEKVRKEPQQDQHAGRIVWRLCWALSGPLLSSAFPTLDLKDPFARGPGEGDVTGLGCHEVLL